MLVQDLVAAMERIAPLEHAEPWDKVGLLVGARAKAIGPKVLLTIDLTEHVLAEGVAMGAGAIIAYHPPIFEPLTRITDATPQQRIVLGAIEAGIAVYSPHTALDAVPGGVCDWLCEGLSGGQGKIIGDCRALVPHTARPSTQEVKLVTFVPANEADTVRNALATAGAGIIGGYRVCSFASSGTGTFLGDPGTTPSIGKPGHLESVSEVRLEMVCSKAALPLALETLRRFHPYEEPPVDVYELLPKPQRNFGPGRRLHLDRPTALGEIAERLRRHLGSCIRIADCGHTGPISTIGVCAGSGGELAAAARAEGCEVYVTGELGHHKVMASLHGGMSVILGEHTGTERGYLPRLAQRLALELPECQPAVSRTDVDPLRPI